MLVNSLALGLLLILAALVPLLLGLLVAMPVLFGSLYASYQAIFAVWADDDALLTTTWCPAPRRIRH